MFKRSATIGGLTVVAGVALGAALLARFVPSGTPAGPLARIFDSLAPALIVLAMVMALLVLILGARRLGSALLTVAVLGTGHLVFDHWQVSLPLASDRTPTVRVLFLNVLQQNNAFADRIVTAALAEDPDVMVFTEAKALYDASRRLNETHPILTPCAFEDCPLIIASRLPVRRVWQLSLNPIWPERYGVAELETDDGQPFFLSTVHLVKPWFSGVAEPEIARLVAQFNWLSGPVVAVGDFNAAPWSRPVLNLLHRTDMRALRRPHGTWPAAAGDFGLPIDLALVHNGMRIVASEPFGEELNSNHRGFVIDLALP